jgi:hypothetical protein
VSTRKIASHQNDSIEPQRADGVASERSTIAAIGSMESFWFDDSFLLIRRGTIGLRGAQAMMLFIVSWPHA